MSTIRAPFRYLSVCSGIESASVAWGPLGWTPVAFAEVDRFASAVLAHHYPGVPNWGDMTRFKDWPDADIDLLVGGTPCQSFSVAGLRKGLDDPRGDLALTFLAIADRYRPAWVVWENVPGVLSALSHDAPDPCPPPPPLDLGSDVADVETEDDYHAEELHAFQCVLAGFSELGYHGAYGTLDAQYFGLAQRRKRVFAVFHSGDWHRGAAALFDRTCLSGHPAPSREAWQDPPCGTLPNTSSCRGLRVGPDEAAAWHTLAFGGNDTRGPIDVATSVLAHGGSHGCQDFASETFVAHAFTAQHDSSEDGSGKGMPIIQTHAFDARQSDVVQYGDVSGPIDTDGNSIAVCFDTTQMTSPDNRSRPTAVACFTAKDYGADAGDISPTLRAGGHVESHANGGVMPAVAFTSSTGMVARRLTPRECERLQGFPDDYTAIQYRGKPARDGQRYKALGNAMAVPVMAWIGDRIQRVEELGSSS